LSTTVIPYVPPQSNSTYKIKCSVVPNNVVPPTSTSTSADTSRSPASSFLPLTLRKQLHRVLCIGGDKNLKIKYICIRIPHYRTVTLLRTLTSINHVRTDCYLMNKITEQNGTLVRAQFHIGTLARRGQLRVMFLGRTYVPILPIPNTLRAVDERNCVALLTLYH